METLESIYYITNSSDLTQCAPKLSEKPRKSGDKISFVFSAYPIAMPRYLGLRAAFRSQCFQLLWLSSCFVTQETELSPACCVYQTLRPNNCPCDSLWRLKWESSGYQCKDSWEMSERVFRRMCLSERSRPVDTLCNLDKEPGSKSARWTSICPGI